MERKMTLREEAMHYARYHREYDEIRRAYLNNRIDREQLRTLRERVKAGDANGAMIALAVMESEAY